MRLQKPATNSLLIPSNVVPLVIGIAFGLLFATLRTAVVHDSGAQQEFLISSQGNGQQRVQELQEYARNLEIQIEIYKNRPVGEGDRHTPWLPSPNHDTEQPELAQLLSSIAKSNEVMVAISNYNYARPGGMLDLWIDNVRQSGVTNAMVLALDEQTLDGVQQKGFPVYKMEVEIPESQKNSGSNHAVSALKFRILTHFLNLGYAVLLSDVDIITLQNPFDHLVRDSDVEAMSDGWDDGSAYGYNDVADDASMGWARYAHSMRIFVFNSGLFYIRPTPASMDLLTKLIHRVETENGWDQALFNECIFFPNSPRNDEMGKDPAVTRRVMDINIFMNSKILFKFLRHDKGRFENHTPVMIHVNYHPDKFERMKAIIKRYREGNMHALDAFPNGSE